MRSRHNDEYNTYTFTKGQSHWRRDMCWECSSREGLFHADTLEVSCNSIIRVMLPALEFMDDIRYSSYRNNWTNVCINNFWNTALNFWERLHKLKVNSIHRRRERYMIKYIWKITQHIVPNIDAAMGHKIKTRNHPWHGTQGVMVFCIEYTANRNPVQSRQENSITVIITLLYNSLPKFLRDVECVKTEKFQFQLDYRTHS